MIQKVNQADLVWRLLRMTALTIATCMAVICIVQVLKVLIGMSKDNPLPLDQLFAHAFQHFDMLVLIGIVVGVVLSCVFIWFDHTRAIRKPQKGDR